MSLSHDQVRRIARLARIDIVAEEFGTVLERLNRVLGFIDRMRSVDTTGIEPMSHPLELVQRLRADEVTQADRHQLYQSVAPAVAQGLYLVPKVIE
jgi:aspartyl-tRNA(Asn)/glutamyl-tRNA(Gln) amidotransferase subunit C